MPASLDPPHLPSTLEVGPSVARELLRQRLRQLRVASDLSPATVAAHTGWSISKLSRIESGEVTVQPLEVRALLAYYGIHDEDEVAALARLSQASRTRQWYSQHKLPGNFRQFVAFENEASVINIWQMLFVPGLLQTEEYARAITALSMRRRPDDAEVLARVKLRMDRQRAFRARLGTTNSSKIVAVIDESVLRRPVGGPDSLRRQLDHLLELASDEATYTIAVTPLDLVHHSGLGGNFELLQFGAGPAEAYVEGKLPDVLFVEAAGGMDQLTTEPAQTALFRDILKDLLDYGRVGEEARSMIRSMRAAIPTL